jgi:hypothetical protein
VLCVAQLQREGTCRYRMYHLANDYEVETGMRGEEVQEGERGEVRERKEAE